MNVFFKYYQPGILIGCGVASIFLALFVLVIKFHSVRKKEALFKIELGTAILLVCDALAMIYKGDTSDVGIIMTRANFFIVYVLTLGNIFFLNQYVISLFLEGKKVKELPKRLLFGFIIPVIGFVLIVVSQFTGIYYYFDENNIYQRGPFFILAFLISFITYILIFSYVVQNRKRIGKGLVWSIVIFGVFSFVSAFAQLFMQSFALIDFATWQSSVVLFWFALLEQNKEMSRAASTDARTGLPNSFGYIHEVEKTALYHDITQYNGFYFDIAKMSQVNNKYGKEYGDKIILEDAIKINQAVEKDEVLGRLGGNFFVALIKKSNTDDFLKLLSDVPIEIMFNGQKEIVHLSAVAGCYSINRRDIVAEQILGYCSAAVNYAKNEVHKPYVFFDCDLEKEFLRVSELEENSRKALVEETYEPFYQPKVDSKTNVLCGAEALVRWHHEGKVITPIDFIKIMEKNRSICDLDFYMLEHVCKDIKDWISRGFEPVPVSVNFSRKNLGNPTLSEDISKVVEKYDIPKSLIQIEVTETIDEYPLDYLIGVVDALRRYGISTAIDDFGTGSSSIALLKEVQFDVLKIDRSFVTYKGEKEKQLLQDIIQMAKNIGIDVIAEGVEELEQVRELNTMGCWAIQGYVFDRPIEKQEFEKRLANKQY